MANADTFKIPPHDEDAEKSVLGCILIDSSAIHTAGEFLRPHHFYKRENQLIFESMISLFEKQSPIDILTVKSQLQLNGTLINAGGNTYLATLLDTVGTSAYVEQYSHIVRNHYVKRRLIEISSSHVERAFSEDSNIRDLIDGIEVDIFALAQEHIHRDFIPIKDIVTDSFERLDQLLKNGTQLRGIPTGLKDVDAVLGGMQPSHLMVLAARPGVGKTSLALNIALNASMMAKKSVGFFSLEMSKEELVDRLLVTTADIEAWRLKTGKLSEDDKQKLTEAMGELSQTRIFIDDTPGLSIMEMRTKARRLKSEQDVQLIIVDYLQLATGGRRFESRVQEVSFISQGLKNLARELQVPVIALSQLSRAVESRGGTNKPQLSDLRESGAIEQDADIVMFIYKEGEVENMLNDGKEIVKLYIAKNRHGSTAEISLIFRGDRVRFYGIDKN